MSDKGVKRMSLARAARGLRGTDAGTYLLINRGVENRPENTPLQHFSWLRLRLRSQINGTVGNIN